MTVLRVEGAEPPTPAEPQEPRGPRFPWNTAELRRKVLLGLVAAWAVAITGVVLFRDGEPAAAPSAARPSAAPSASAQPLTTGEVYQALLPSVVLIQTEGGGSGAVGRDAPSTGKAATGTGVVANADGTVLTALHVVDGAASIKLSFADGTESAARVASTDPEQDIATLTPAKLPETLVPAVLGGGVRVGDAVVAIGNPLGLTASTTDGVVSGLDRKVSGKSGDLAGLIQFDAAVNPGSSGGPLINDRGAVVGIIVALANPTTAGTFIGIGFAVPIGAALGAGEGDGQAPPL
jgi:S1-C subfamily serine protease